MKKPFKKSLTSLPVEEAHGGSGRRQLIFSKDDPISSQMEAMTKGFLSAQGVFDWHNHKGIDEFFIVTKGTGKIEYEDGSMFDYKEGDVVYSPSNLKHKITNTGSEENQFIFVRLNH